jgi:hypothetical protein
VEHCYHSGVRSPVSARASVLTLLFLAAGAGPAAGVLPTYGSRQLVLELPLASNVGFSTLAVDLNCDGRADVLVANGRFDLTQETMPLVVLLNDGQGGFVEATAAVFAGAVPTIHAAAALVAADFNGDGRPDVFVADFGNDHVPFPGGQNVLILSTPDCRYVDATAGLPQQTDNTHSVAAGDLDGDGDVDLYIGNVADSENHPAQIWLNDGAGGFTRGDAARLPPVFTGVHDSKYLSVLAVDVDGDGALDLVLGASQELPNAVLRNDGTGHFAFLPDAMPPKPFPDADPRLAYDIRALDLDGGGLPGLVLAYSSADPPDRQRWLQVLVNNGDGTFRDETETRLPPQTQAERASPKEMVVLDLDGDGVRDFAVKLGGPLVDAEPPPFYRNAGAGVFTEHVLTDQLLGRWHPVDVDGDGGRDFFTSASNIGGNPVQAHFVVKQTGAVLPPGVPEGVTATRGLFADRVRVGWTPVWGAAAYQVRRAPSATDPALLLATVTTLEHADPTAAAGTVFFYEVRAVNDAGTSASSARASGFAGSAALLRLFPSSTVSFGTVTAGSTALRTLHVTNQGNTALAGSASVTGPYALVSGSPFGLAPGASAAIVVEFLPAANGTNAGQITVTSNGGTATRGLAGTGVGHALHLATRGSAVGTVSASAGGLACAEACSGFFAPGTALTLTATPTGDGVFAGWSGACAGTDPVCHLVLNDPLAATARFAQPFADPILAAGSTAIRSRHVEDLRAAVTVLRARAGLAAPAWTDPVLVAGSTPVRRLHVLELRDALAAVYVARSASPPVYTDPALAAGVTLIRVPHIGQVRDAVRAIE